MRRFYEQVYKEMIADRSRLRVKTLERISLHRIEQHARFRFICAKFDFDSNVGCSFFPTFDLPFKKKKKKKLMLKIPKSCSD